MSLVTLDDSRSLSDLRLSSVLAAIVALRIPLLAQKKVKIVAWKSAVGIVS